MPNAVKNKSTNFKFLQILHIEFAELLQVTFQFSSSSCLIDHELWILQSLQDIICLWYFNSLHSTIWPLIQ